MPQTKRNARFKSTRNPSVVPPESTADVKWDLDFTSSSDNRHPTTLFMHNPHLNPFLVDALAHALSNSEPPTTALLPAPFPEISPDIDTDPPLQDAPSPQPFSYGYGFTRPSPPQTPASGLAQSIPPSPRPTRSPASTSTHKRFPAPLPFTRLVGGSTSARPVVDLGTAPRERTADAATPWDGDRTRTSDRATLESPGEVVWAKWDYVRDSADETRERRLLFVGYASAFQVWDCTDLEALQEILNVDAASAQPEGEAQAIGWSGHVLHAAVMPEPRRKAANDPLRGDRPLIGILTDGVGDADARGSCVFILYSLRRCEVVTRARVGERAVDFQVNEEFIVISTVDPPTLFILSSTTLDTLSTISSSALLPYLAPPPPPKASESTTTDAGAGAGVGALETLSNAFTANFQHYIQPSLHQQQQHKEHYLSSPAHRLSNSSGGPNTETKAAAHNNLHQDLSVPPHTHTHTHTHALVVEEEEMERRHQVDRERALKGRSPRSPTPSPGPATATASATEAHPRPVFALSHRLLAFASPAPSTSHPHTHTHTHTHSDSPPLSLSSTGGAGAGAGVAGAGVGVTQSELGSVALRAGGSVLSGMRALGGMALSAAKSRVGGDGAGGGAGGVARFFSRSAPVGERERDMGEGEGEGERERERERRYSSTSPAPIKYHPHAHTHAQTQALPGGCWVTVLDLFPLLSKHTHTHREPEKVAEFVGSRDRHLAGVGFSGDGCGVVVVPRDGQVARVFQLRFGAGVAAGGGEADGQGQGQVKGKGQGREGRNVVPPWHMYDLRRGRTGAVVEAVECARDGRWVAVATRKRTVHLFAVNPYGGKPDHKSHMEGRVRNVDEVQPMPTELSPLVRLRVPKQPTAAHAPLAVTFLPPSHSHSHSHSAFPSLLPSHTHPTTTTSSSPPLSISSSSSSPTRPGPVLPPSSSSTGRPANFQDILLFDPAEGVLSLRRCVVELKPRDRGIGIGIGMGMALGGTSISLPGMGGAGRLSASASPGARSRLTEMMDAAGPVEMVARESVVATWSLRGRSGEGVVKVPLGGGAGVRSGGAEWLSQAELSSFSRSTKLLPRSIYLSHQFSFHTLGEDYHALIRRYQLDISGDKLDVRKEVQASAYPAGSGESFVEGFDIRNRTLSSSFDEPLASALAGGLEYRHSPSILPMLPNGMPRAQQSFRTSIPIRTMTGLGSEGLGRIRREINRVRSPRLRPRPDSSMSASVPLEFDEEDEDFVGRDMLDVPDGDGTSGSRGTSRGGADSGASPTVSTPATSAHPLDDEEDGGGIGKMDDEPDAWSAWSAEDRAAVEEAERFDDISVVGFLDEEQEFERRKLREKRGEVLPEVSSIKRKGRGRRRV